MKVVLAGVAVVGVLAGSGTQPSRAAAFNPDPVFPAGPISGTASHRVIKLEHVASVLAGRHAAVNCWSGRDWAELRAWEASHHETRAVDAAGVTYPRTHRIQLSPFECQVLAQVIAGSPRHPLFTAWAVTVLAHEAAHASGIRAESRAECRAIETEPRAAELLGIPKTMAKRLQHIYRGTVYPHDLPRYRTPPCAAGKPGLVVADTVGDPAALRPIAHVAKQVAASLSPWQDEGGGGDIGPVGPCGLVRNRAEERARFGEYFQGPRRAYAVFTGTILKTKREFSLALAANERLAHCDLRWRRAEDRELHSGATESLGRMPTAVTGLSRRIKAFRIVYSRGETYYDDRVHVFDPANRFVAELYFVAPAGKLPVPVEVRAVRALLRSEATMAAAAGR